MSAELSNVDCRTVRALACAISSKWDSQDGGDVGMFFGCRRASAESPVARRLSHRLLVAKELGKACSLAQIGKLTGAQAEDSIRIKVDALCMTTE